MSSSVKEVQVVVTDYGVISLDRVPVSNAVKDELQLYKSKFHRPWYWWLTRKGQRWARANRHVLNVATAITRNHTGW